MSYLVLARKYRPGSFASVTGQEHVTRTLANAIKRGKVAHAYLFAGPRGVGKTSIARIFAKALNCEKGPTAEPCTECANCREIAAGTSLAVREIDGASHNSVDNVRELIESFRTLPAPGSKYKVYIIDEVHMLSTSAFNALLNSLEEPPPHTVFILATTEIHKIPETVISRCQKHEFRALTTAEVERRLREIAEQEKIAIDDQSLSIVARVAGGSMRDAQSLLDRVHSFCDGAISAKETAQALGVVERAALREIAAAIIARDPKLGLESLSRVFAAGLDPSMFLAEFAGYWRDLLVIRYGGAALAAETGILPDEASELSGVAQSIGSADLQDLVHAAREGADNALRSTVPRFAIEALIVRLATRVPVQDLQVLLGRAAAGGGGRPKEAPRTPAAPPKTAVKAPASGEQVTARAAAAAQPAVGRADQPTGSWSEFVARLSSGGGKVLGEQLRRLSVVSFGDGTLEAVGPEFSVSYLQQPDNSARLEAMLRELCGGERWRVILKRGAAGKSAESGSLVHLEEVEARKSKEQRAKDLREHPKVKGLLSAFPGSTLDE